ncbi:MAG: VWA domain-containing protein [Brumimicrobium sp.]
MSKLLLLAFSIIPFSLLSQIVFDKTVHDFGELSEGSARYVDFYLKNESNETAFILSVDKPMEVVYIQKAAMITPDSTSVIRFQINQRKKGRFNYKIPVFTSDKKEPTVITLKGNLIALPKDDNNFAACPDFNQSPSNGNPMDFKLTVETIDKSTGEKLDNSIVALIQNGSPIGKWKTNSNGKFTTKVPLGITYFYATHSGYLPAELGTYVNFKRNKVTLELEKLDSEEVIAEKSPEPEEEEKEEVKKEELENDNPQNESEDIEIEDIIVEEEDEEEIEEEVPPSFKELDKENFDPEHFMPINVVFVVDVSSSMRQADRLELLKYSLTQLVKMLRPEDKIGLVSYATNANVLLKPTSGENKEEINEIVKDLKASGLTAGGEGIKLGYRQAKRNFIKNGKNQVIIITDGAFNKNSGNYKRYIKRYLRKDITLTVVGIKSNERSEESMKEAAELGDGRFVLIEKLADAQQNLKQEIRIAAFKYD